LLSLRDNGGIILVSIRPYKESDNTSLLEIEKLCPFGNEKSAVTFEKSPVFIASYNLYDNWKYFVAEDEGKVIGGIGWTVKHNPLQKEQYIYLAKVMIHPEFRRKGIATKLLKEVEKDAQENGSSYIYLYVYGTNDGAKSFFRKHGYSEVMNIEICGMAVYKKLNVPQKFTFERINKNEIRDAIGLINDYYAGREQFIPYTSELFESFVNRIPGYGLDNFWVVKDKGEIVACAGLWDSSVIEEICYIKEPFSWKVMNRIFGFLRLFSKMPKIPAEGEYFGMNYIVDYALKPENSDAISGK
jgi:ribosomal protein S18 acetylase RimI-like enzyme